MLNRAHKVTRKDRERSTRKEEILDAARTLFALKGYHNTTLEEIARHAEFGKGTIYNYFSSKDDLFLGIVDRLTDETLTLAGSSVSVGGCGIREKLGTYAKGMVAHARANADLFTLVMRRLHRMNARGSDARSRQIIARAKRVWEILARPIEEEMHAGKMQPADPVKLAALFDGMLRLYCLDRAGGSVPCEDGKPDATADFVVSIFFDGVVKAGNGR